MDNISQVKFCLCGCGTPIKNKYVHGHNARVQWQNPEHRQNISEKNRQTTLLQWQNPEHRQNKIETKQRHSNAHTLVWMREDFRLSVIASMTEAQNRPEIKLQQSARGLINWQDPEYIEKQRIARNLKPNKSESFLIWLLNELFPGEWRYTGDFSFWINGKNPDFVNCNGQKKIIEFNGDYWHRNDIPGEREKIFAEFGYDTLILTNVDLALDEEKLRSKLIDFHMRENPYAKHHMIK